jgi:hypothetical protein
MSVSAEPNDGELDDLAESLAPFNRRIVLTGAGFSQPTERALRFRSR